MELQNVNIISEIKEEEEVEVEFEEEEKEGGEGKYSIKIKQISNNVPPLTYSLIITTSLLSQFNKDLKLKCKSEKALFQALKNAYSNRNNVPPHPISFSFEKEGEEMKMEVKKDHLKQSTFEIIKKEIKIMIQKDEQSHYDYLSKSIQLLTDQIQSKDLENIQLKSEIQSKNNQINEKDYQIKLMNENWKNEKEKLEEKVMEMREKLEIFKILNNDLVSQIEKANNSLKEKEEIIKTKESLLFDFTLQLHNINQTFLSFRDQLNVKDNQIKEKDDQITIKENQINDLIKQIQKLENKIEDIHQIILQNNNNNVNQTIEFIRQIEDEKNRIKDEKYKIVSIMKTKILEGREDLVLLLNEWTEKKWRLQYRGSRDGFKASSFHELCDHKGSALYIAQDINGYIFGGFTSIGWKSTNKFVNDPLAFIFTLTNPHHIPPTKYLPSNVILALFDYSAYLPTFGFSSGHDMYTSSNCNVYDQSCFNFPSSYNDTTGKGKTTFTGNNNWRAKEVEVFIVDNGE